MEEADENANISIEWGCFLHYIIPVVFSQPLQSMNPFRQLDMIFDLLGSPSFTDLSDLSGCPPLSLEFLLRHPYQAPNHAAIMAILMAPYNQPRPDSLHVAPDSPDPDLLKLFTGLLNFSPVSTLVVKLLFALCLEIRM